jgi:hypothetical protein
MHRLPLWGAGVRADRARRSDMPAHILLHAGRPTALVGGQWYLEPLE